jgi:starvation-inducible DNA-binding protein
MKGSSMGNNHHNNLNPKLQIPIEPNIGIESDSRQAVVEILNITLADEVVLKTKTRCARWNVRGADFVDLHNLFGNEYIQLNHISDEIAERSRMLGGYTIGSMEEFLAHARLGEQPGQIPDMLSLLASHEAFIRFLRVDARNCGEEYEDEGTSELLVRTMKLHEKMAWILRSSIEAGNVHGESQKREPTNE